MTAWSLLVVGTIFAGVAVWTGFYAEGGVMISRSVRENLLEHHERLMVVTFGVSVLLTLWAFIARPFPKKGRAFFLILFLVLLVVMTFSADYGARMVTDYNAGGTACSQPIEFTK